MIVRTPPQACDPARSEAMHVVDFDQQVAEWREAALKQLPAHVRALGPILRRSVRTHRFVALERCCKRHGFTIERRRLPLFRDFLITQRLDLKDLEPDARARLRLHYLGSQDKSCMTADYRDAARAGDAPLCRDCCFFITPPNDADPSDPNATKSCVELRTKGSDVACFGFTRLGAPVPPRATHVQDR